MISLSLMALVLLLLVSVAAQFGVEQRSVSQDLTLLKARLNAELGASAALGDLQKFAGADQRVTATSSILVDEDGGSQLPKGTARWTGVWSSKLNSGGQPLNDSADRELGLDDNKPHWFVSGEVDAYLNTGGNYEPSSALPAGKSVNLFSAEGLVNPTENAVSVLTETVGADEGRFAFWVSDDGVKARIDLDDTHASSAFADSDYFRTAIAQQADPSVVLDSARTSRPFEPASGESLWKGSSAPVSRVVKPSQIPFLSPSGNGDDIRREFFHDFTTGSSSVLSNTKDGGLQRDLSTALIQLPSDLSGRLMFPSVSGETVADDVLPGDPGGPTWAQLADHYRESLRNADLSLNAPINMRQSKRDQVGIQPVITRSNFIVQLMARRIGTDVDDARDYAFSLGVFPMVTLWNPYDRDMVLPDMGLWTHLQTIFMYHEDDDTTELGKFEINRQTIGRADATRKFVGFVIEATTIRAGEAINFSPPNNSFYDTDNRANNVLKPGASGQLVRGFFSDEITISKTDFPDPIPMFKGPTGRDFSKMRAVTILPSSSSNPPAFPAQYTFLETTLSRDIENRMIYFMGGSYGDINDIRSRAIADTQLGVTVSYGAKGSSVGAGASDDSPFDIQELQTLTYDPSDAHDGSFTGDATALAFAKSRTSSGTRPHLLTQLNPRATFFRNTIHHKDTNPTFDYEFLRGAGIGREEVQRYENFIDGTDSLKSYVGLSNRADEGSDRMVLFEAPSRAPLGIGQLMHANLQNTYYLAWDTGTGGWQKGHETMMATPAYSIGNSFANIHLPLDSLGMEVDDGDLLIKVGSKPKVAGMQGTFYDYSYQLNDVLWDDFFFSTILPETPDTLPTTATFPLPNSRMVLVSQGAAPNDLFREDRSAAQLMLEGGFNINSTSTAAWESLLGAMRDIDPLGSANVRSSSQKHAFSRISTPIVGSNRTVPGYESSERDSLVAGFRSLTDDQISDLAASIVREIRTRGQAMGRPFLSLSEFVNRSIRSQDLQNPETRRFAYTGALQFAIDQSEINGAPALNEDWNAVTGNGLWEAGNITSNLPSNTAPFLADSVEVVKNRPLAEGVPGSILQADILSKIGAVLRPRSDTFTIHAYGDTLDPTTGAAEAEARYEVVVQRMPEFVDSTDQAYDNILGLSNLNQAFGREFQVVSTRWISEDESI
ncbi:MAG: hypothetical protein AAGJ81_06765 [Verrucomicrobiota bacterium]